MDMTIDDIAERISPVAREHDLHSVWLFGSRARGDNDPDSDVDLLIDGFYGSLTRLSGLYLDFKDALGTELDLVTLDGIRENVEHPNPRKRGRMLAFQSKIDKEKVLIYGSE